MAGGISSKGHRKGGRKLKDLPLSSPLLYEERSKNGLGDHDLSAERDERHPSTGWPREVKPRGANE